MPHLKINNANIHVLEMNPEASETIVMVHGMFTNMSVFYFNIAPKLAEHYHVVLYDLRSHGMSDRVDCGYDVDTMAQDLIGLIDALNLSKIHLVGYSYGGLIALRASMLYGERIDKLAIIESPKPDEGDSLEMLKRYGDDFFDQYMNSYKATTNMQPGRRQMDKNKKLYEYLFKQTSIKEDINMDNDLFERIAEEPLNNPTLLLYGTSSDCSGAGDLLEKIIPDARLYKGEGNHNLPIQSPQWISDRLIEFMK